MCSILDKTRIGKVRMQYSVSQRTAITSSKLKSIILGLMISKDTVVDKKGELITYHESLQLCKFLEWVCEAYLTGSKISLAEENGRYRLEIQHVYFAKKRRLVYSEADKKQVTRSLVKGLNAEGLAMLYAFNGVTCLIGRQRVLRQASARISRRKVSLSMYDVGYDSLTDTLLPYLRPVLLTRGLKLKQRNDYTDSNLGYSVVITPWAAQRLFTMIAPFSSTTFLSCYTSLI